MCQPSPHIQRYLAILEAVRREFRPAGEGPEERAAARILEKEERICRSLAEEPTLTPADAAAKLEVLTHRLRQRLDESDEAAVITYMLAESLREGLRA